MAYTIDERVDRAIEALGGLHGIGTSRNPHKQSMEQLADLLASLMHFCEAMGVPFGSALDTAFLRCQEEFLAAEAMQANLAPTISARMSSSDRQAKH